MPTYRRSKRKPYGKRSNKRRTYRKKRMYKNLKGKGSPFKNFHTNNPFKPRLNAKLVYTSAFVLADAGSSLTTFGTAQTMAMNDIYDPDITNAGHQPYLRDTLATLYSRYKVNGVHIQVDCNDPTVDSLTVGFAMLNPDNTGFNITTYDHAQLRELPMCAVRYVSGTGSQTAVFKGYVPMYAALTWTKKAFQADQDGTTAAIGASPGTRPRFVFAVSNMRGGTGASIVCTVKMTYYTTFYDRQILGQS